MDELKTDRIKVLIIAYYFPPHKSVGAIRPAYWHERLIEDNIDSYVITASPQEKTDERVIVIEPIVRKRILIKDQGANWAEPLIKFLTNSQLYFDVILFTGGPFMHFSIIRELRQVNPSTKIILDFRDPFACNPRFKNSWFKIQIKRFYERQFLKHTDEVITVNKHCRSLLNVNSDKCTIIDNGFDERIVYKAKKYTGPLLDEYKINFVYAGSFGKGYGDPTAFQYLISRYPDRMDFHHIGNENHSFPSIYEIAVKHGMRSYSEAISVMKACDVGLIFTGGHPFESTTKVFDYMACNLDILIISDLGHNKGALYQITKNYPKVTWINNNVDAIDRYLISKEKNKVAALSDVHQFSRDFGYKKLLTLLKDCIANR